MVLNFFQCQSSAATFLLLFHWTRSFKRKTDCSRFFPSIALLGNACLAQDDTVARLLVRSICRVCHVSITNSPLLAEVVFHRVTIDM